MVRHRCWMWSAHGAAIGSLNTKTAASTGPLAPGCGESCPGARAGHDGQAPFKRRGCPSLTGSPSSFLFFSTLSVSFLSPPGLPRCNCRRAAQHPGLRRRITPVMLVVAQRRRKRRGSHQWICHDDHTACITTDATERPAPRYASESLPAEPRRLDALARHFRMSCARYHCYSQRRPGGSFVRRRQWQRRCTSRDIILRSPVACMANHELSGSPSSAPTRASRRVGRRNQPARRVHARSEDAKGAASHPATRREQTRTRARQRWSQPQHPARKYHVRHGELHPGRLFRGRPGLRPI